MLRILLSVRLGISIHALREEGDASFATGSAINLISIHALREEGDQPQPQQMGFATQFQSTPSARRATKIAAKYGTTYQFQSTPSARRATSRPCRSA